MALTEIDPVVLKRMDPPVGSTHSSLEDPTTDKRFRNLTVGEISDMNFKGRERALLPEHFHRVELSGIVWGREISALARASGPF